MMRTAKAAIGTLRKKIHRQLSSSVRTPSLSAPSLPLQDRFNAEEAADVGRLGSERAGRRPAPDPLDVDDPAPAGAFQAPGPRDDPAAEHGRPDHSAARQQQLVVLGGMNRPTVLSRGV